MQNNTITVPCKRKDILGLPTTTGIYQFIAESGEILYIGKSVNLKARLLSHLENSKMNQKEAAIVDGSATITCVITDSEFKALLLESQLISSIKPKYNVRWRDDKSYLYIKVIVKDTYPKLSLSRREYEKDALYFGPFPSVHAAENLLREIRRVFPFCLQKRIYKQRCFYAKIGLCNPCPNVIEKIQDEEEKKRLQKIYRFNVKQAIKVLEGRTDLVLKNLYKEIKELTQKEQFEDAIQIRNRIRRLENLIYHKKMEPDTLTLYNRSEESIRELKKLLKNYLSIEHLSRIECYDVSNTMQKDATASMVVFTDGLINKKEYRRFKIENTTLRSDFEMMQEVLERRFKQKWDKPDLVVIDGGKPQLRFVQHVIYQLAPEVPFIGIAKRPDRIIIGKDSFPIIRPALNNLGFSLIRAIRDESHRFAKKYHTLLRSKNM